MQRAGYRDRCNLVVDVLVEGDDWLLVITRPTISESIKDLNGDNSNNVTQRNRSTL